MDRDWLQSRIDPDDNGLPEHVRLRWNSCRTSQSCQDDTRMVDDDTVLIPGHSVREFSGRSYPDESSAAPEAGQLSRAALLPQVARSCSDHLESEGRSGPTLQQS
jgi:hypothetical protein